MGVMVWVSVISLAPHVSGLCRGNPGNDGVIGVGIISLASLYLAWVCRGNPGNDGVIGVGIISLASLYLAWVCRGNPGNDAWCGYHFSGSSVPGETPGVIRQRIYQESSDPTQR